MLPQRLSLATLTTLRVGGEAQVVDCATEEEIKAAILREQNRGLPLAVLGEGSNTLAPDEGFDGIVLRPCLTGIEYEDLGDEVLVVAGAGVSWDELVRAVAARGLWGIENLAGIPGLVGAAPVQNIGAYGAELSQVFEWCEALPRAGGAKKRFTARDAAFGYRDSIFKRDAAWIITRVALRLRTAGASNLSYKDLAEAAGRTPLSTPAHVGEAVRGIRAGKFPDLATHGTAGSFFKNPTIASTAYAALAERYPGLLGFPAAGGTKVPLAWILDHVLNLKGYRKGSVRLFENQPLVLVTEPGATARAVDAFARDIAEKVFAATGITVEREVQNLF
jgi:UDP-N-acetylmuramate dehydrogenase